jgi:hypothetical protein
LRQKKKKTKDQDAQEEEDTSSSSSPEEARLGLMTHRIFLPGGNRRAGATI